MKSRPEIVIGAARGVKLRFTPLPLKGFGGEYGLFVPVREYDAAGQKVWQYKGMPDMGKYPYVQWHVGAGILRGLEGPSGRYGLSMLSLVALTDKPECDIYGEDVILEGLGDTGLKQSGVAPLLSDIPGIGQYLGKRYANRCPMSIEKLIPASRVMEKNREYARGVAAGGFDR